MEFIGNISIVDEYIVVYFKEDREQYQSRTKVTWTQLSNQNRTHLTVQSLIKLYFVILSKNNSMLQLLSDDEQRQYKKLESW